MTWHATIAFVLLAAGTAADIEMGAHESLPCAACHVTDPEGRPIEPASAIDRQAFTCQPCHESMLGPHQVNHPVFVRPRRALLGRFPLDAQGRLTCSTCHDVHGTAPAMMRAGVSDGCSVCHAK